MNVLQNISNIILRMTYFRLVESKESYFKGFLLDKEKRNGVCRMGECHGKKVVS